MPKAHRRGELIATATTDTNEWQKDQLNRLYRTLNVWRMPDYSFELETIRRIVGCSTEESVQPFESFHGLYQQVMRTYGSRVSDSLIVNALIVEPA